MRALKSTSKPYPSTQLKNLARGKYFEELALKFFFKNNLVVQFRNRRVWGVEHDFIVTNENDEVLFVEVKSLSHVEDLPWRVSANQKRRLHRSAAAFLEATSAKSLGVWLLAIEDSGRTHFMPLECEG